MGGSQSNAENRYRTENCDHDSSACCEELLEHVKNRLEDMERKGIARDLQSFSEHDVLFYYLMKGKKDLNVECAIRENSSRIWASDTWFEVCSQILYDKEFFCQFLSGPCQGNPAMLEYLFYKQPQLLFNIWSKNLVETMIGCHLHFDNLHRILLNSRDRQKRTFMFYGFLTHSIVELYRRRADQLYELLSIVDVIGQTALHVNAKNLTLLLSILSFDNMDELRTLLTIKDSNRKSIVDVGKEREQKQIAWFTNQVENTQYPLYRSIEVLILYNTHDRSGAEDEAHSINDAFQLITPSTTKFAKMGRKDAILELIGESANRAGSGLVVILMSHGNIGTIDDSTGRPFALSSVERTMCVDQLQGKPKILITQCCQVIEGGYETEQLSSFGSLDGGPPSSSRVPIPYVPESSDFCAIQSSVTGQPSERGLFLPYLADYLNRSTRYDSLSSLVRKVSTKMSKEGKTQIPIIQTTLRGTVCLKNIWW